MKFNNFSIHSTPFLADAYCKCGHTLKEVSNGFLSVAMFCAKCENTYIPKLIKIPSKYISKEFLKQARKETAERQ